MAVPIKNGRQRACFTQICHMTDPLTGRLEHTGNMRNQLLEKLTAVARLFMTWGTRGTRGTNQRLPVHPGGASPSFRDSFIQTVVKHGFMLELLVDVEVKDLVLVKLLPSPEKAIGATRQDQTFGETVMSLALNLDPGNSSPETSKQQFFISKNKARWVEIQPFLLSVGYQLHPATIPTGCCLGGLLLSGRQTKVDFGDSRQKKTDIKFESAPPLSLQLILRNSDSQLQKFCSAGRVQQGASRLCNAMRHGLDSVGRVFAWSGVDVRAAAVLAVDRKKVMMKWMARDSSKFKCIKYLSRFRSDPRNRVIPILQTIFLPNELNVLTCRDVVRSSIQSPPIPLPGRICGSSVVLHWHSFTITIFAIRSHFCYPKSHTGNRRIFEWEIRCSVGPVSYYYINFGLSDCIGDRNTEVLPEIPELSLTVPYNPFKVVIFQLGLTMANVIKGYPALRAFSPVANRMMSADPAERPEPAQSLEEFNHIVAHISAKKLHAPNLRKHGVVTYFAKSMASSFRKD
ncbi:hypothetical protein DFH08DRAFT_818152 [Mycena albidolilacea]|uniref:Uncharacterized protein n=1 Tax=Mycena albidolilacea TaxID=1033008 RepID=A0AAD6ZHB4_9AGAR|nr:hypothetical protein DFH08DRAFT_818152 [Mycena albidolilacea]